MHRAFRFNSLLIQPLHTMKPLITDSQLLISANMHGTIPVKVYDDGYGPIFILRDSMGVVGLVRARTWEDAYSIAEDELFPEADETIDEIVKEYGFQREHKKIVRLPDGMFVRWETVETPDPEAWADNELFQEAFGFRPNGANATDTQGHGIYAKDLNGESLDVLTPALLEALQMSLEIETAE